MDVRTRLEHLETLNAIGEVLNRAPFFREAVDEALDRLVELTGARAGWVFLARTEHGDVHYSSFRLAAWTGLPPAIAAADERCLRVGACECMGLFRVGKLDRGLNMVTCSRLAEAHRDGGDTRGMTVHASVPLQGRTGPVGILNLAGPDDQHYDDETLALLNAVGRQLGTAYERAQAQLQRRIEAEHTAALEERNRVARDIHDSVTQLLFGAHLALRVAREEGDEQRTAVSLDRGAALVEQALDELRGLVELLRSADLDQGLTPALRRLAERVSGTVRVHLDVDEDAGPGGDEQAGGHTGGHTGEQTHGQADRHPDRPSDGHPDGPTPEVAEAAWRIAQAAVHNVLKHADAENLWLRVVPSGDRLTITVDDDGVGLPEPLVRGVGLDSIEERATSLGGSMEVGARPGGGARVRVEMPWSGS